MADLDLKSIEKKWAEYWEKEKIFKFNPKTGKKIYSIDTPPPTVSGEMHIGHAYSYSQEDFIARYKRMRGFEVFYPFGTDDNGLPTERLIEKLKNVKSKSMTRADFIDLCLKTLKEITPAFIQDWKNLGVSCDYGIYYSTIDKHARKISQKNFIELFKAGRIYKESFPTIYCPECQTPVAQAELEDKNCHKKRSYPKTRLHRVTGIEQAVYRADIDKISGWRLHLQFDRATDELHLKDIVQGQLHDDVRKVIKAKKDRYR